MKCSVFVHIISRILLGFPWFCISLSTLFLHCALRAQVRWKRLSSAK